MTENQLPEKKQANELALEGQFDNCNLAGQELDTDDFIIPRIYLMQGTSPQVTEGTFGLGEIIHSVDERKLGDKTTPVEILPFYIHKTYETVRDSDGSWVKTSPWGSGNPELEWEEMINIEDEGMVLVRNLKNYNIYAIIAGEEDSFPCVISFRSSAGKDAKKITSHFLMMSRMKKAPFNVVWNLSSEGVSGVSKEGKKQAYQKYALKKARNATMEEMESASNWLTAVATNIANIKLSGEPIEDATEKQETKATKKEVKNYAPKATPKTTSPSSDAVDGEMPF